MKTTDKSELTPQQAKEQFIQGLINKIKGRITPTKLTAMVSTCDYSGWDRKEHLYMPEVARRLISEGYTVSVSVNHGVTDYVIGA